MGTALSEERSEQVRTLFREVVDLGAEQRVAHLDRVRWADSSLRREVESLLEAYDRADQVLGRLDRQLPWLSQLGAGAEDPLIGRSVSHYEIVERLGSGGMGVVYRARDTKLDRPVALKFLPPHLSLDREAKARFVHEAKAASALDHANICTIYEIDETRLSAAGPSQIFIAMAYYAGETLRQRIARGPLPRPEALDYAVQIAEGLERAHEAGIVHRDVKPANVLLTERGQVKLVDFGIAKVQGENLTRTGVTLGTLAYMSPEQARGDPVDARADLWSLGVVLHEMLTGQKPVRSENAILLRRDAPEPAFASRPQAPEPLALVVERLLRTDPAERYSSAGELLADLRALRGAAVPARPVERSARGRRAGWALGGAAALVLVVSALGVLPSWQRAASPRDARTAGGAAAPRRTPSLAVLPLQNYSGDPAQEYFADGMTEELTTTLTKIEALRVIAHRSVLQFKHSDRSVPEIARALGVGHVVDGSVLQDGSRVRITATLIDATTNTPVWGESFDRDRRDVLALQREVALAIAREIEITLTPQDRKRLADTRKVDPDAFDLYVKGTQARYRLNAEAFREAADYFSRAVAKDSSYAPAYAGLASTYALSGDESRARRFANKALALDPDLAEPHVVLGVMRQFFEWDWAGAEDALKHAIRLNPGYAEAHHELSMLLMRRRRFDEAMREAQRTLYLAPMSARFQLGVGEVYLFSGRYHDAVNAAEKAYALDSSWVGSYLVKGMAYGQLGQYAQAEAALERCLQLLPSDEDCRAELGYVHAVSGKRAEARRVLDALKRERWKKGDEGLTCSGGIAGIYAGLGERERALTWVERLVEDGGGVYLAVSPSLRPLHGEPRFQALLKMVGLDQ